MSDFTTAYKGRVDRRQFFAHGGLALGAMALSQLGCDSASGADLGSAGPLHVRARAKRIIYLFMHGGPSQIDLLDYKPRLNDWHGEELPASVQGDQRLTGMTASKAKPLVASKFRFAQQGS